ncbi:hypothetical protein DER44DRAFT_125956 [Fusarium oxysporum]|nr:hypothetical protein DER44DRAFT_125956 [Fusarium oxysporum]
MGSSAPHHRHQSSLEGFIDFSTGASPSFNPDELDKGAGVLRRVIEHFEPLSTEKPYNRPRLVRLTYEHARSDQSKSKFLHAFLRATSLWSVPFSVKEEAPVGNQGCDWPERWTREERQHTTRGK